jgi:hypothetical protein
VTAGEAGWLRPLAIGLVGALAMFGIGFRRAPAPAPPAPSATLRVPHARGPMTVDGETDEPDWTRAPARTGAFLAADGSAARPASEARLLWDDAFLYLSLYAADEDIRAAKVAPDGPVWTGDSFSVELGSADGVKYSLAVGPSGIVTDAASRPGQPADYRWQSGAKVAIDLDGTLDDARDRDEEWVVELAIPWQALGIVPRSGTRVALGLRRCDAPAGHRSCGAWGQGQTSGVLVLSP